MKKKQKKNGFILIIIGLIAWLLCKKKKLTPSFEVGEGDFVDDYDLLDDLNDVFQMPTVGSTPAFNPISAKSSSSGIMPDLTQSVKQSYTYSDGTKGCNGCS
tara:strand:+ start:29383 stop:29688 length:306 start_codon:yes stop_codon:yes gene_type:complete